LEPDEEKIAMATEGLGFSALFGFGKKMSLWWKDSIRGEIK